MKTGVALYEAVETVLDVVEKDYSIESQFMRDYCDKAGDLHQAWLKFLHSSDTNQLNSQNFATLYRCYNSIDDIVEYDYRNEVAVQYRCMSKLLQVFERPCYTILRTRLLALQNILLIQKLNNTKTGIIQVYNAWIKYSFSKEARADLNAFKQVSLGLTKLMAFYHSSGRPETNHCEHLNTIVTDMLKRLK
jgi:hypothetical protein